MSSEHENEFEVLAMRLDEIGGSSWEDSRVITVQAEIQALWRRKQLAYPSPPSLSPNWAGLVGASDQVRQAVFRAMVGEAQARVRAAGDLFHSPERRRGPKIKA